MNEVWENIKGYEGVYQVSNLGKVRSLDRIEIGNPGITRNRKGKVLSLHLNNRGYKMAYLSKNGKTKATTVHRLVATNFIPPVEGLEIINHKDQDRTNNHVDNLEWCDFKYNNNYGTAKERKIATLKLKNRLKPVCQYSLDRKLVNEYESLSAAGKSNGFGISHLRMCCNGKLKTAYGFLWRFKEPVWVNQR